MFTPSVSRKLAQRVASVEQQAWMPTAPTPEQIQAVRDDLIRVDQTDLSDVSMLTEDTRRILGV